MKQKMVNIYHNDWMFNRVEYVIQKEEEGEMILIPQKEWEVKSARLRWLEKYYRGDFQPALTKDSIVLTEEMKRYNAD